AGALERPEGPPGGRPDAAGPGGASGPADPWGASAATTEAARADADASSAWRPPALTGRETEVLLWVARGKTNRDIAEILGMSPRTVNKHLEHVFEKLGVETRTAAAAAAARLRIGA
ncbi:MAG TPA: helix-turn-helix transcriptional regulator, partial [Burkholderiaceae bacterium]|nr:helix-turn-helix transcriptional regulator [Burkholderiaceae bacterium]